MKIGIVAATSFEIEPTINFLSENTAKGLRHNFEVLITGIGLIAATYQLTQYIRTNSPDYMIQAGIAGSFTQSISLGDTVIVADEVIADLGVQENNFFTDLFEMKLADPDKLPYSQGRLINPKLPDWRFQGVPVVHGSTVNQISTQSDRIRQMREKYGCDIESMEGAAFHYVCLQQKIPFVQIRCISNYVGERNKKNWRLKESIENLNLSLIRMIELIP